VVYPISSKHPMFKKFRKSLTEFFERLIFSSAESDQLYNTELMRCIQYWVTPMSSSQIRGFRHTSTIIALEIETALADVAASVEKEAEVIARQRKGERKRKGGASGGSKELDAKANAIREKRTKVAEYLKDFVDGYVRRIPTCLSLTCGG
jgi:cohesin complex subunit SA-1/2